MSRPHGPASRRIWRPELAYAIGVLVTDGNLSSDGRHICFVSTEVDMLRTLAQILEATNRICLSKGQHGNAFRLTLGDRLFYDWLLGLGIPPRKSLRIGAVDVPDEVFRDFLRGHLDGDGSITSYVDRSNTRLNPKYIYQRLYVRFLSASLAHVEWLQQRIHTCLGLEGYITTDAMKPGGTVPLRRLAFAKKESIALLRWIYYAAGFPCLKRKRALAEPFLLGDVRSFRHPGNLSQA